MGVRARLVAASLAAAAVARGARVTVWWASTPPRRRQLNRPGELVGLLQFLAPLRPAGAGDLEGAARLAADTASGQGRGNAVLITDGLEPTCLRTALLLRQRGFAPLVVAVRPAVELTASVRAAALASGVVEAVDAETGATRRLPVSARGLTEALARREARCGALLRSLADHGIAATTLAPELPFDTIARDSIRGRRERARP